jgi:putative glutamine amidotransferase
MGEEAAATDSPVIGISTASERARWGAWETDAMVLPRRYADRVAEAGGIPVLLPPEPGIDRALRRLDGLVLSGGGDIDPARYGAPCSPETRLVPEERDAAELAMFRAALSLGLPILGICRGIQVINVALGGTLHQHLPDVVGHNGHSPVAARMGTHEVRIAAGSRLAAVLGLADSASSRASGSSGGSSGESDGLPSLAVPTHHHQAIDRLGGGLTATAWAADGTVEAVELDSCRCRFGMAVQWHPEADGDLSLFRALASAAVGRVPEPAGR